MALPRDQCVTMAGVGWRGYETILRLRGDRSHPRMIYLDGDLFLVSPALPHERINHRIGFFIDQLVLGLRLPCLPSGHTTFKRRKKRGGVEGDHSYYLANEPRVRGKMRIDLRTDPPPDLAVEVVNTHPAGAALRVYGRLGVPEVWVCELDRFRIMVRQGDGRYAEAATSLAFPFLTREEIESWILRPFSGPEFAWMEEAHRWVFDVLAPRVRGVGPGGRPDERGQDGGPVTQERAVDLAMRLVERKRSGLPSTLRSVRDEGKKWVVTFELAMPPGHLGQHDVISVDVYKKTGVTRSIPTR